MRGFPISLRNIKSHATPRETVVIADKHEINKP